MNNKISEKIGTDHPHFTDLQSFVGSNSNKKVIAIQGLGFVGAVMSLVCANSVSEEYAVIGVDIPTEKSLRRIKLLNEGSFPLVADDPKIDEFDE